MDSVTQQNAALVEEAAAAAGAMQEQAAQLAATVGAFKLDHAAAPLNAVAAVPTRRAAIGAQPRKPAKLATAGGNDRWEEF